MEDRRVRVRFAPSPTGALHIGGVRTALYNYMFARQHGGDLVFRIEDTDSGRFVPGAEEYIIESFRWLGIKFDEGVSFGGSRGPYRQSERRDIYKKYVKQLLDAGKAYIAFDTPEELEARRREVQNFQYDAHTRLSMRNSLTMTEAEVAALVGGGAQYVVRFKVEPGREVLVDDLIRGEVRVKSDIIDDKVLYKSADELPTYHLANIVDDHLMEITHVIRGEEWLPSAPLHVLLYEALGWTDTMPRFAHLPLLLKPEGKGKLSKRDGDRLGFPVFPLEWHDPKTGEVSAGFRESGYFPEAVINFLALLGWNPGTERELYSLDELCSLFDITKCSKAGAKFDYKKCVWFNHEYMLLKSNEEVAALFAPVVRGHVPAATDAQGYCTLKNLSDSVSYTVSIQAKGYVPRSGVALSAQDPVVIQLGKEATMNITVKSADGEKLGLYEIYVRNQSGATLWEKSNGFSDQVTVTETTTALAAGADYKVQASASFYTPVIQSVHIDKDKTTQTVEIELYRGTYGFKGKVVDDASGRPIQGVKAELTAKSGNVYATATTDSTGSFQVMGRAGLVLYTLRLSGSGYETMTDLGSGEILGLNEPADLGTIRMTATGGSTQPAEPEPSEPAEPEPSQPTEPSQPEEGD